ncbi:MAG: hypothetical protein JWP28_3478 [Phenylobacterium sp.]|uniref:hypothetical protein n=1 Tax=Phenylobacterium sp. TaxID=1871053 RepID=UPI00342ED1AD|nr:hypothetical protein [Phenylobacterium sp.]
MVVYTSELWTVRWSGEGPLPFAGPACDTASQMDIALTLMIGASLLALAVFAGWRGARPPNPHRGPRLMPWRFIMLLAAAGLLPIIIHMVNLMGVTTGH